MFSSNTSQVSTAANYIEDVFSTYLYTGTGANQTITNGIDLSTYGGLTWIKIRSTAGDNQLYDTVRGTTKALVSNTTAAQATIASTVTSFTTSGYVIGTNGNINGSGDLFTSWTFRKQPKFFDIVTYTGNGANRDISHNLGSVPGMIIVKSTSTATAWAVYHRSLTSGDYVLLNTTAASVSNSTYFTTTAPTSTTFRVGTANPTNAAGQTFEAFLFAHNAGGFGLTGTDNVISCGSFTTDASNQFSQVTLGYEPQLILYKNTTGPANWNIFDNMRGLSVDNATASNDAGLYPNTSGAEALDSAIQPNATGFISTALNSLSASSTYIYIAIRRGPMKVPTDATKVFAPTATTSSGATTITTNFPVDLSMIRYRSGAYNWWWSDRLRGNQYAAYQGTSNFLFSNTTDSEQAYVNTTPGVMMASNTGIVDYAVLPSGYSGIYYNLRRAPSFFDEVCYTGDGGSNRALSHNLAAVPELAIFKRRSGIGDWLVWTTSQSGKGALLDTADIFFTNANVAGSSTWTASTIYIKNPGFDGTATNGSGSTYVAYLFASCPGVSKVGSYTGTGATQTISCGFTGGARFVLIKRTDTNGNWYVWDTARGMVAGTDPKLGFNLSTAESNANWVYTATGGFQIVTSDANVNASGGTYIFLAIA